MRSRIWLYIVFAGVAGLLVGGAHPKNPPAVAHGLPSNRPAGDPAPATDPNIPTPCSLAWGIVPSANVGSGAKVLPDVAVAAPNDIRAVGAYYDGTRSRTLTEHWNGTTWTVVPSP